MPSITHIKINDTIYDIKDENAFRVDSNAYLNNFTVTSGSPQISMKSTNINLTTTPSENKYAGGLAFYDANNTIFGRFRGFQYSSGNALGVDMFAYRTIGNTEYYNDFRLTIDSAGKRGAYFTEPKVVREALGMADTGWKTLENSTVFSGTIYYRKFYNFVELRGFSLKLKAALSNSTQNIGTLNNESAGSSYYPSKDIVCYAGTPGTSGAVGLMKIGTGGVITFYKPSGITWSTSMNINFQILYLAGS